MDARNILEWQRLAAQRLILERRLKQMRDDLTDLGMHPETAPAPAPTQPRPLDVDWVIRLRPLRRFSAPVMHRLKRLLKTALRAFGFRAVSYYQVDREEEKARTEAGQTDKAGA